MTARPSNLMTPEELVEFQEEFKTINRYDDNRMRQWFLDYPEMSGSERSLVSGLSPRSLDIIKKRLGLTKVMIVEVDNGVLVQVRHRQKGQPPVMPPGLTPIGRREWIVQQAIQHKVSINLLAK